MSTPAIAGEPDGRTRGSCTLWKPRCPQRLLAEATGRSSGQPEARPGDVREPPESQLAGVETAVARASASWRSGGSLTAPGRAASGCPELRPASATHPFSPRRPAYRHTGRCFRRRHLTCALTCGTCAKQRARGRRHECDDIGADAHVEGDVTAIMERLEQRSDLGAEVPAPHSSQITAHCSQLTAHDPALPTP